MTYEEFQKRFIYDLEKDRLGEGGFGKVFKAFDTHLDKYIALKISEAKKGSDNLRLKKEVEIAASLPTHQNIARYEECYTYQTPAGIFDFGILQYYEEGNLLHLINRGKISDAQKKDLVKGLLTGIKFLHDHDIVHRDLKPQNILIAKRGEVYVPKISDFGISKQAVADEQSFISNSLIGGTIAYSAPEQLKGVQQIHRNTDLWSFGILLYQILAGQLPFTTGSHASSSENGRMEMIRQITTGKLPVNIKTLVDPYPRILRMCLKINPEKRVKDAEELLVLFENYLNEVIVKEEPSYEKSLERDFNGKVDDDSNTILESITYSDQPEEIEEEKKVEHHSYIYLFKSMIKKIRNCLFFLFLNKKKWINTITCFLVIMLLTFTELQLYHFAFRNSNYISSFLMNVSQSLSDKANNQLNHGWIKYTMINSNIAIAVFPYNENAYFIRGKALLERKEVARAEKNFKYACSLSLKMYDKIKEIVWNYINKGDYKSAFEILNMKISWKKDDSWFNLMGFVYVNLENYSDAISAFKKVIELNSTSAMYYNNIAEVYFLKGNYQDAFTNAKKAYNYSYDAEDKAISLFLQCISMKMMKKSTETTEEKLLMLLFDENLSFGQGWSWNAFENWLSKANINHSQYNYIRTLTYKMQVRIKAI